MRRRAIFGFSAAVSITACAATRQPAENCAPGRAPCGGVCADTHIDIDHCGACGKQCGANEVCEAGACTPDPVALLAYDVVDAEYSRALDRIVLVSASPSALHIYDPGAAADDVAVVLASKPTALSVSPDGHHAVVAHDGPSAGASGYVSWIDLDARKVTATVPIVNRSSDVVAATEYAYAFPVGGQWEAVEVIDLKAAHEVSRSDVATVEAGVRAKLHPSEKALYTTNGTAFPSSVERYDLTDGVPTRASASTGEASGTTEICGDLWISKDGARIFTACGDVFASSDGQASVLASMPALQPAPSWAGDIVSIDDTGKRVAALVEDVRNDPHAADKVALFEATSSQPVLTKLLPRGRAGDATYQAYGRYVFFSADGARIFVVVDADSREVAHGFGVVTL